MELKPYQQQILDDLKVYLDLVQKKQNYVSAFNEFWNYHPRTPLMPTLGQAVEPYKDIIERVPHVCIKVPTGGGKTFIASSALSTIFSAYDKSEYKSVVWLVPSNTILTQTLKNLKNPNHPYRQRINSDFRNKVEVFDKAQALNGAGFSLSVAQENLCIFVMSFDSLRAKKKEDRKVYQENGNLQSFESIVPKNADGESDLQLMKVFQALKPVVIVDESHNAETDLSVEMLKNLNPSFILDFTATPRKNSNIICFTDALELKRENMVKLPVIVYNHEDKEGVISSALELQRRLELTARELHENENAPYIRPIVLFQAQPKNAGDLQSTYNDIKKKLLDVKIPEEQIKIKIGDLNELKDIDLLSKDCPVRYIITVNALKEGWDCPFAYILASLANKTSEVDVQQILGRVLRMPWTRKSKIALLNMSYVLTCQNNFLKTLDNIVAGLNNAGFSEDDYKSENLVEEPKKGEPVLQGDLFGNPVNNTEYNKSEDTKDAEEGIDSGKIYNPNVYNNQSSYTESDEADPKTEFKDVDFGEKTTGAKEPEVDFKNEVKDKTNAVVDGITQKAEEENKKQEEQFGSTKTATTIELKDQVKTYKIKETFAQSAQEIKLPQFMHSVEEQILSNTLFEPVESKPEFFNGEMLLKDFKLSDYNTDINFNTAEASMYRVDISEEDKKHVPVYLKVDAKNAKLISDYILDPKNASSRVKNCTAQIKNIIGKMYPIPDKEIDKYITKIVENFNNDQIVDLVNNLYSYSDKIKEKIRLHSNMFKHKQFKSLLDKDKLYCEKYYLLPESINPAKVTKGLPKSLYDCEIAMDGFEKEVINDVANLPNIEFWTKNIENKGFYINGFINHYPDFIIKTKKGKIVLLETKGDHLHAEDKIELGALWESKANTIENIYKYCLVYNTKVVSGAYTKSQFLDIIKDL